VAGTLKVGVRLDSRLGMLDSLGVALDGLDGVEDSSGISVGVSVKVWVGIIKRVGNAAGVGVSETTCVCKNDSEVGVAYVPHREGV
jgi:hypothetical protein